MRAAFFSWENPMKFYPHLPLALLAMLLPSIAPGAASAPLVNPLRPVGADPWVLTHDGAYFHMHTTARDLTLWRTRRIGELAGAEKKVIWTPPADTLYSESLWAPEIHRLDGKWYVYFSARDTDAKNHRVWVLENTSPDPMTGDWEMKGKLATPSDKWAIDGSVFDFGGRRYFTWSGWAGDVNGVQHLYLAAMENPWTLSGERVRISTPTHPWEKFGDLSGQGDLKHVDVNEGPQALIRGGRLFIVYSASGCWTDRILPRPAQPQGRRGSAGSRGLDQVPQAGFHHGSGRAGVRPRPQFILHLARWIGILDYLSRESETRPGLREIQVTARPAVPLDRRRAPGLRAARGARQKTQTSGGRMTCRNFPIVRRPAISR